MKECEALAKYLSFVISLNPQSLPGMERPETDLEFAQNVFVHQSALLNGLRVDISILMRSRSTRQWLIPTLPLNVTFGHLTRALQQTASLFDHVGAAGGGDNPSAFAVFRLMDQLDRGALDDRRKTFH